MTATREKGPTARDSRIEIVLAVAVAVLCAVFSRRRIDFDGMAFLGRVDDGNLIDPAHPLYPPLFYLTAKLAAIFGLDAETAGRFLSVCGAAATFRSASRLARYSGSTAIAAFAGAFALVTAPIFFLQATTIEVHALATAALVTSYAFAAKYRSSLRTADWISALAAFATAVSFHVATSLGVFALIAFSGGMTTLTRARRLHVGVFLFGIAAIFLGMKFGLDIRDLFAQARHFVDVRRTNDAHPYLTHARLAAGIAREDALVPILSAVVAVIFGRRRLRPIAIALILQMAPFLVVYLALGIPVIGLLLPIVPAFAVAAAVGLSPGSGNESPETSAGGTAAGKLARGMPIALALFAAGAFLLTAPGRFRDAKTPDPDREAALALAAQVPENTVLFAGVITHHVRRLTTIEAISVAELMRRWKSEGIPIERFPEELRTLARSKATGGAPVLIDSDAGRALIAQMGGPRDIESLYHPTPQLVIRTSPLLIVCRVKVE